MCHGHPRYHPCSHTSINWYYCPTALIDLETGYETPCSNVSFAPAQTTKLDCPLKHCDFKGKGGLWICCSCKQGPNTHGWCMMPRSRLRRNSDTFAVEEIQTTCDHGCCKECTRFGAGQMQPQELTFPELHRGSASRMFGYGSASQSHRRGPAMTSGSAMHGGYAENGGYVEYGAGQGVPFASPPSSVSSSSMSTTPASVSSSSSSGKSSFKIDLDYRTKRPRTSKKGKARTR